MILNKLTFFFLIEKNFFIVNFNEIILNKFLFDNYKKKYFLIIYFIKLIINKKYFILQKIK